MFRMKVVFQIMRKIIGPEGGKATRGWRKMGEELHNFYSSPNNIRVIK
jgi:hypothetical protein